MHSAKDVLSVDETVSTVLDTRVPECTCYKIVKPLVDDHSNLILRVVVKEGFYCIISTSRVPVKGLGSTLVVFRYPEHPRFSDGIPDLPTQ